MRRQLLALLLSCCIAAELAAATEMFFKYKTKLNGVIQLSFGFSQKVGLTASEKQSILDMTNAARHRITTGQESNTPAGLAPNATNMMAVEWDDDLAAFAQNWADKCTGGHSPKPRKIKNYANGIISENLSGPTLEVYQDMYGEVHGWTYVTQKCRKGDQCGHYNTLVSWANFRLGCGFKLCVSNSGGVPVKSPFLVCEFAPYRAAGLVVFEKRLQFQYEYWTNLKPGVNYKQGKPASITYAKTVPCSQCPQGWDYCMKGGLCATKRQCDTDPGNNECVCNLDKTTCENNGGSFQAENCRCKCPPNRYGRNCALDCKNLKGALECGITCGNGKIEIFLCYSSCGSCGVSVSRPYRFWMEEHPAPDADNLKVRANPPHPSPAIPKDVKTSSLPDRGHCPNKEDDYFCENIRRRNYCSDAISGPKWKHFCAGSCNSCGNKEWANLLKKAMKEQGGGTFVPAASVSTTSTGWQPVGGASSPSAGAGAGGGGWAPVTGGGGWTPTGGAGAAGGGWAPAGGGPGPSNVWKSVAKMSPALQKIIAAAGNGGWTAVNTAAEEPGSSASGGSDWETVGSNSDGWTDAGSSDGGWKK